MRALRPRAAIATAAAVLGCSGGGAGGRPSGRAHACDGEGRLLVGGACAEAREAAAFCGPAARVASGACALVPCEADELLDRVTGACVTARDLRDAAARDGLTMLEGDRLVCPDERTRLIVAAGALACVPREAASPRSASTCAPGSAFDEVARACVAVVDGDAIDLARWSATVLGRDGGRGTRVLCGPLAEAPARVGLVGHGSWSVRLAIDLDVPNEDVTALDVRVRPSDPRGAPLVGAALEAARHAVTTLTAVLDDLGRVTTTTHVSTTVRCLVTDAVRPVATPGPPPRSGAVWR